MLPFLKVSAWIDVVSEHARMAAVIERALIWGRADHNRKCEEPGVTLNSFLAPRRNVGLQWMGNSECV